MARLVEAVLLLRLQPLRRPAPQRIEMLGAKEAEMADLPYACIRWPDADDLRLGRGEAGAQQLDCGARCPGVVDEAERAQGSLVIVEILASMKRGVAEQIALLHHPARPLQESVLRQVHAEAG